MHDGFIPPEKNLASWVHTIELETALALNFNSRVVFRSLSQSRCFCVSIQCLFFHYYSFYTSVYQFSSCVWYTVELFSSCLFEITTLVVPFGADRQSHILFLIVTVFTLARGWASSSFSHMVFLHISLGQEWGNESSGRIAHCHTSLYICQSDFFWLPFLRGLAIVHFSMIRSWRRPARAAYSYGYRYLGSVQFLDHFFFRDYKPGWCSIK